jgi:polysaccharide chain length determinant protein (PEP-CTERM system associated)
MENKNNNILEYVDVFWRRKWVLVLPTLSLTILAVVLSNMLPSYYRSTTLIMLEHQQVPEKYVTPTDLSPFEQRLNTISQQIMSRSKLGQIIKDFNLDKERKVNGLANRLLTAIGMKHMTVTTREEIIETLRNNISVEVIGERGRRGGDAFSISYTGRDPRTTMEITTTLASLFIEENLRVREQYAEGTAEFLVSELEKAKLNLEEQESALRGFKERHMGSLPVQLDANLRTLDRLQLDLQTVTSSIKNTEDKISLLEAQLGVGPGGTSSALSPLEVELDRLKRQYSTLLSVYKENYPDVLITKNRITEVEAQLKEERAREALSEKAAEPEAASLANPTVYTDLSGARFTLASLKKREADIRRQITRYERRVERTPANEQRLTNIKRDYDISLQNYKSLLEKKLNARLAENLEKKQKGERFRIIDSANLPESPYSPNKLKITLLGAMAGGGLGVALVLLLEYINPAFRKPEDFYEVLPYPVLVSIPVLSTRPRKGSGGKLKVLMGRKRRKSHE